MRKNFLQTLLVVVLSVIGVSQCWAATYTTSPFTFVEYNSGACNISENPSISYNGLNHTCSGTIDRYADDGGDGGCRMNLWYSGSGKNGVMNLFSYSRSVEPYTKVVLTYDYTLFGYTDDAWQSSALYQFDDETTAKTTALYFDNGTPSTAGKDYRLNPLAELI